MEERILMKVNDLEDKIMSVWLTADDIDTFLYRYLDSPAGPLSEDDITNTLLGIKTLHEQRCQRLWDAFEKVLSTRGLPVKSEVSKELEELVNKQVKPGYPLPAQLVDGPRPGTTSIPAVGATTSDATKPTGSA